MGSFGSLILFMIMQKKLLITLGDSFTEGVGCYDMTVMPEGVKYNGLDKKERAYQRERFHKLGWPNHVGRELGFDKVINLGLGGTSNSYSAKMLVERVLSNKEWVQEDVYVIWMGTEPHRFSFFDGCILTSFLPSYDSGGISEAYLKHIENVEIGSLNEQVFYTKVIEQVCQNNNFKLAIVHWSSTYKKLYEVYCSPYYIFPPPSVLFRANLDKLQDFSTICGHPNESGYKKIADYIISGLKKYRPEFVVGEFNPNLQWEWHGSKYFPEKKIIPKII